MACPRKERTGSCSHYQCPFSGETAHGYECVDVFGESVNGQWVLFCEVGDGCLKKCALSWENGDNSDVETAAKLWLKNNPIE